MHSDSFILLLQFHALVWYGVRVAPCLRARFPAENCVRSAYLHSMCV